MANSKELLEAWNNYKNKENELAMTIDSEYDGSDINKFYQGHIAFFGDFAELEESSFTSDDVDVVEIEDDKNMITIYDQVGKKVIDELTNTKEKAILDRMHTKYGALNLNEIEAKSK